MTQSPQSPIAPGATTRAVDERLLAAELAVVEARTETKFAQLIGKIDIVVERMGGLQKQVSDLDTKVTAVDTHSRQVKTTIIATVIATGLAIAALAWAAVQIFQSGMGVSISAVQTGLSVPARGK